MHHEVPSHLKLVVLCQFKTFQSLTGCEAHVVFLHQQMEVGAEVILMAEDLHLDHLPLQG